MIQQQFAILCVVQWTIFAKVHSTENSLGDSDEDTCSDGVGWRASDAENENIWTASSKNLDIFLHLEKILKKTQCISSMSIAIEGEIFRFSGAPESKVVLRSRGWQGCTQLDASVTVVDKEGRTHRRADILKPVRRTTCSEGIGWRRTETEDVWKVSKRTVTLLPHMLALRPQLIRTLSIAVGKSIFEIPSPGSIVTLNVPDWSSCSRIKASVTAWDQENVMHRRQDLLVPKETQNCAGIGWQRSSKANQLWRISDNSVTLLVHMLALRPKQIRTMVVAVGREMIEIPDPPTRITLYNTKWNRCSPVSVKVTVWDKENVLHRREDVLDPIQNWRDTTSLQIQRNEFAPSILKWMSEDFSRCLISATLSLPGTPEIQLDKNTTFAEIENDHCNDHDITVHYKFKGGIKIARTTKIAKQEALCISRRSNITNQEVTEEIQLARVVSTVGGAIGTCLLIFVVVTIFTGIVRWKRKKRANLEYSSSNAKRIFMKRSRRRREIENSLNIRPDSISSRYHKPPQLSTIPL